MSHFILMENKPLKTEEKRQTGYIYKIVALCDNFDDADTYYGSTFNKLSDRMAGHRRKYKQWKMGKCSGCQSFQLFGKYSVENCKILLLETVKEVNKRELTTKEYSYIFGNPCINKLGKSGWWKDKQEYNKQYQQENKQTIAEYHKQYQQQNKQSIAEYQKEYRQANKDTIKEKHNCECGGKYTASHKTEHERTKKHQAYLQATE